MRTERSRDRWNPGGGATDAARGGAVTRARAVVYKYVLPLRPSGSVTLPQGARPLSVGEQPQEGASLSLWCEVDPVAPATERRRYWIVATGRAVPRDGVYVGTVLSEGGALVWHVYLAPPLDVVVR